MIGGNARADRARDPAAAVISDRSPTYNDSARNDSGALEIRRLSEASQQWLSHRAEKKRV
jgi:hypothetical protein